MDWIIAPCLQSGLVANAVTENQDPKTKFSSTIHKDLYSPSEKVDNRVTTSNMAGVHESADINLQIEPIEILLRNLADLSKYKNIFFLDYPDHLNAGDHLIWLSTIMFANLNNRKEGIAHASSTISYSASLVDFDERKMSSPVIENKESMILLQGGGNLGDLWPESQLFREFIINKYPNTAITILPQTIYFKDMKNLERVSRTFNSHPALTIHARDRSSFELAKNYFHKCNVFLTPDMTAILSRVDLPDYAIAPRKNNILFLCRQDNELLADFSSDKLGFPDESKIDCKDWSTYSWLWDKRGKLKSLNQWYWRIPGNVTLVREVWQRGLKDPEKLLSRLQWTGQIEKELTSTGFDTRMKGFRHSLSIAHESLTFFAGYELVVTNRLHGAICARLLGIPAILLPGAYSKNIDYHKTWLSRDRLCRFVDSPERLSPVVEEVLSASSCNSK
jgi:pyruvyl transferase EpsO